MAKSSSILKSLFSSNLRIKVLSHFFLHPEESFHIRGLAGILDEPVGTVARELAHLENAGIMESQAVGNQKRYSIRKDSPIHDDLRNLFLKTTGAGEMIRSVLKGLQGVELAFIYGSFASGEANVNSDIDLMVVGAISEKKLAPAIARVENSLGREVNYTVFTRTEVEKRLGRKGDFVHEVFTGPRIMLAGGNDDRLFRTS